MAYKPLTSTSPNTPFLLPQSIAAGATGGKAWGFVSTELQAAVGTSDFISDGKDLGMQVDDYLTLSGNASGVSVMKVTAIGSTYVSLSVGHMISSAS